MALGTTSCARCGAKVREDRVRCVRCGHLVEAAAPCEKTGGASRRAIGAAGAIVATAALGFWLAAPRAAGPSASVDLSVSRTALRSRTTAVVQATAGEPAPPRFVDADRAARAAYQRGDMAAALAGFEQAVSARPGDADARNALGQVLVRLGRAADALPHFDRAVALDEGRWSYRFNRARAYAQLEQWTRAVDDYTAALALFPGDSVTEYNLGLALDKAGRRAEALEILGRAAAGEPGDPTVQLGLAVVADRGGRGQQAVAAYRRYLELAPPEDEAVRARARIAALTGTAADARPANAPATGPAGAAATPGPPR